MDYRIFSLFLIVVLMLAVPQHGTAKTMAGEERMQMTESMSEREFVRGLTMEQRSELLKDNKQYVNTLVDEMTTMEHEEGPEMSMEDKSMGVMMMRKKTLGLEINRIQKQNIEITENEMDENLEEYQNAKREYLLNRSQEKKNQSINYAKKYLEKIIENMIYKLERIKYRIMELDIERKDQIIAELDSDIAEFNATNQSLIAGKENVTALRRTVVELHRAWSNIIGRIHRYSRVIVKHKLETAFMKLDNVTKEVENYLEQNDLPNETDLAGHLDEAQDIIEGARANYTEAKTIMDAVPTQQEITEAKALIKDAYHDLIKARKLLRRIIVSIKTGESPEEIEEEEEVEAEAVEEEEEEE